MRGQPHAMHARVIDAHAKGLRRDDDRDLPLFEFALRPLAVGYLRFLDHLPSLGEGNVGLVVAARLWQL